MDPFVPKGRRVRRIFGREYPGKLEAIWSIVVGCIALFVMAPFFASFDEGPGGFVFIPVIVGLFAIGYGLYYLLARRPIGERVYDFDVGDPAEDLEERLRRLDRMRRDGLISEAEFTQKRAEIVGKL